MAQPRACSLFCPDLKCCCRTTIAMVHGLFCTGHYGLLPADKQLTLSRRSVCCRAPTAVATASANTVTAQTASLDKLSAAIPLSLNTSYAARQTTSAEFNTQQHGNPAGRQLLAAVAGAAAVATATADLQTDSLFIPYAADRSDTTFARSASPSITDELNSSKRQQQQPQLSLKASRQLTRQITNCRCWQDLQQLHIWHVEDLNVIHVSAMLSKLGKMLRDQGSLTADAADSQQLGHFLRLLEQTATRLLSNVQLPPAAMTVLRPVGSPVLIHEVQEHSVLAPGATATTAQPQQLSSIAWGFATACHQPSRSLWSSYYRCSTTLLPTYSAQELATAVWAAAKLQQHPPAAWMSRFAAASAAVLVSGSVRPQEMCMMLWGLVKLGVQGNSDWWRCLQQGVQQQLSSMKPRDMAQVLWAHARLQVLPPAPWLSQVLAAAAQQQQLHRATGRDMAMLLWALAALQQQRQQQDMRAISTAVLQAAVSEQQQQHMLLEGLLRTMQMSNCKLAAAVPQDYAHILWALAVLNKSNSQHQQRQKQRQQQQQQRQQAHANSGSSRQNSVVYSMYNSNDVSSDKPTCIVRKVSGRARHSSDTMDNCSSSSSHELPLPLLRSWCHLTWQYTQPATSGLDPVDAAQLLWAATQLDPTCWPDKTWLDQYWHTSRCQLRRYNAQAITVAMWAGYKLGCNPPGVWLLAAVPVLQQQLADLQPAAVCQLLFVLAKLRHRPRPDFMEQLLTRLQLDAHQLQPRAFACVIWSLGRLCYQPGNTWWSVILHHLSETVDELSEREVTNVVWGMRQLNRQLPDALMMMIMMMMQ